MADGTQQAPLKHHPPFAITGVGLDHTRILGDTLEAIAGEKAAIIKPGRTCVLGVGTTTPQSVQDVFLSQAASAGVVPTLLVADKSEDVEGEVSAGQSSDHPELPHAHFFITKSLRALVFRLSLRLSRLVQPTKILPHLNQATRLQILLWQPAWPRIFLVVHLM